MPREQKLIVDDLLVKPSAVSPMLFVGLGGCGCRIVAQVARHLHRRPDFQERYQKLVKFALVDTNVNDLESYREIADETFLVSDFEKEQYANLASGKLFLEEDPYFTQWVPQGYRFRAGDTAGAGQIRIESRLGVFYHMKHKDFVPRFRKLLEELKSHELGHRRLDSSEIRIVLCYSVAGGTGSGSHLPIAYMLRDLAREMGKPWMIGVAVMPAVFEDKTRINKDGTFANGYAALKETEHLMRLGAPDSRFYPEKGVAFHYNPADESKTFVRDRPFEFVYLIDKPESFSVSEPIDAAADGLYLQFFSPLFGHQASDYDNYTQHQRFLVPHDFEAKGILGFSTFYGSYGAAVLLVPVPGLIEYCSQAAALTLMRANFLRDIPSEPIYQSLRIDRQSFDEVTLGDDKNERPIHRADFVKKEPAVRDKLRDRLFMKRIQLLAACEIQEGEAARFLSIFRHGHRVGERPKSTGGFELRKEQIKTDREQLADRRMLFSINAMVLPAIAGEQSGQLPGLLANVRKALESRSQEENYRVDGETNVAHLKNMAAGWRDQWRQEGLRLLRQGYKVGTLQFPGMDSLIELDFLKTEAAEVDLTAQRYAVLRISEDVNWDIRPDERADFSLGDYEDSAKIREKDAPPLVDSLRDQAVDQAMAELKRSFIEMLGDFKTNLDSFAKVQRTLDMGFEELEREQSKRLQKLREEGDPSANQYILDAEALSIEGGRRLWDFYYEDKVAVLPELSLGNKEIQRVLSGTVADLSVRGAGSTTATLQKLFDTLHDTAERIVHSRIAGDPKAGDRDRQEGLTLSDALELEVIYRALYLSDQQRVDLESHKAIREIVSAYRSLEPDQQEDLGDVKHTDYLRDKIKRVVKEKASLLCVYEEARDQHGGVRPDHVFLAAIDENFKNGTIEEALRGADIPHLEWVTKGWHNPKEIIFYRAVLNVPLYVFGRLPEMQHYYHLFKSRTKRSKVLHIDKNWEEALSDLDPISAKEAHRQKRVRSNVINFATLLTTRDDNRDQRRFIVRREGQYFLVDPAIPAPKDGKSDSAESLTLLGDSLTRSIERLPEILESEPVKYLRYQQVLTGVRQGLAPQVLVEIVRLPFLWRQNRDELRNQYGANPDPLQQQRLRDYGDAFERLRESLDKMLETLRNREIEHRTMGDDMTTIGQLPRDEARNSLRQSIEILRAFSETWQHMEHPDEANEVSDTFLRLFKPIDFDVLQERLKHLRDAAVRVSERPDEHLESEVESVARDEGPADKPPSRKK